MGAGAPTVFERRWAPPQNSWVKVCINVHLLGYNVLLRVQWPFVTLFQAYEEDVPQKCSGGKYSGKLFSLTLTVSVSLCWTLTYICFQRSKLVKYLFIFFVCVFNIELLYRRDQSGEDQEFERLYIRGTGRVRCFGAKALEASLKWFGHERTRVRRMVL